MYDEVVITHDGIVLKKMDVKDAFKAHVVQFGALYVYNVNYEQDKKGKPVPSNIRHFFEFVSVYLWGIRSRKRSSGTGDLILKRISTKVLALWKKMS